MNINILYEDEEVIVCEKPAGVAAQTRRLGQADMESLLKNYRAGKGEQPYIGVVHRLDHAGARSDGFCQNKRSCGGFKPSGADKNGR